MIFQYNDVSITKVVLTDKDCSEIAAAGSVVTEAECLLCHIHVLAAVRKKLDELPKLHENESKYIYDTFHDAVYSFTRASLENCREILCSIGDNEIALGCIYRF